MSALRLDLLLTLAAFAAVVCSRRIADSMSQNFNLHENQLSFRPAVLNEVLEEKESSDKVAYQLLVENDNPDSAPYKMLMEGESSDPGETTNKATVAFAASFENHMVLQRAPQRAVVWGYSSFLGERIILELGNNSWSIHFTSTVVPGWKPQQGIWRVELDPISYPGPYSITVSSNAGSVSLTDVLFGDVWVCSGQSNMEFTVLQMFNAEEEMAHAGEYPDVRLYSISRLASAEPLYDVKDIREHWSLPSKATLGGGDFTYFSAVCWMFGKNLNKALKVPIGLIDTTWGGTPVEAWSPPEALQACGLSEYPRPAAGMEEALYWERAVPPNAYSSLWNGMVHPILNMTIYGAIWYQGEANVNNDQAKYNCTFPEMIKEWRNLFNQGTKGQTPTDFPFGFVQLAPNTPDRSITQGFPDIRWHQTGDYGYVPNPRLPRVFMAVAVDLPDFVSPYGSIHPRDKTTVGERMLPAALNVAYDQSQEFQGPLPVKASKDLILFTLQYNTSVTVHSLNGFEFCCSQGNNATDCTSKTSWWVPAPILRNRATEVTLDMGECGSGQNVLGVRYLWRESPCAYKTCAVYSLSSNLPSPPFVYYFLMQSGQKEGEVTFDWSSPITIKN